MKITRKTMRLNVVPNDLTPIFTGGLSVKVSPLFFTLTLRTKWQSLAYLNRRFKIPLL